MSLGSLLRRLGDSSPSRFAAGVLGADKYQKYLEHHARSGHDHEPMTEKEYWRDYYRHQEEHPGARCC